MVIGSKAGHFRLILSTLFVVFSALAATGQIAGGLTESTNARLGGNNYIIGSVFWPSGSPVNTRISIRLSTPENGDIIASTDDAGKFVFSGIANGVYTLVIDSEPDYETVREEVDVIRRRAAVAETYTLTIRLREKRGGNKKSQKPAVVKAEDAGVTKKAFQNYEKAAEFARTGEHRQAIEMLKLALVESPQFVSAWNELGVQYMRLGELGPAEDALIAALRLKPDSIKPLVNLGMLLFRQTKYTAAEAVFRHALNVKSDSGVARYFLGRILYKLKKHDEALKELEAALKIGSDEFNEAHRFLAIIYLEKKDHNRVVEELEAYLKLNPKAPDAGDLQKVIEQNRNAAHSKNSAAKP